MRSSADRSSGQVLRFRCVPDSAPIGLGPESLEAWPAAGGGLLVGIAEPAFAGTGPLRRATKTAFLRIDAAGTVEAMLPYVHFEEEARACIRAIVAHELCIPDQYVVLQDGGVPDGCHAVVDISPTGQLSLQVCAAAALALLVAAAAEEWHLSADQCRVADGEVIGSDSAENYAALAAAAPWCALPTEVRLACGRTVSLLPHAVKPAKQQGSEPWRRFDFQADPGRPNCSNKSRARLTRTIEAPSERSP